MHYKETVTRSDILGSYKIVCCTELLGERKAELTIILLSSQFTVNLATSTWLGPLLLFLVRVWKIKLYSFVS